MKNYRNSDVYVDKVTEEDKNEPDDFKLVGNVTEKGIITFFRHQLGYDGIKRLQGMKEEKEIWLNY